MRAAGSTLTFSRSPLPEALAGLAALGYTTVELAALEGWAHVAPSRLAADFPAEAAAVRRALAVAPLRVTALNAGLGDVDGAEGLRRAAALFRLAATLGALVVTLPAGPSGAPLDAAAGRLQPLVAEAARYGVTLSVETHIGALTEDPAAAVALCRRVPGLKLTLDPSHYWAGPSQGQGWEVVLPYVAHVHLRDAGLGGWDAIQVWPGKGAVDFRRVAAALSAVGYRGGCAVEYIDTLPVVGGGTAAAASAEMARQAEAWDLSSPRTGETETADPRGDR